MNSILRKTLIAATVAGAFGANAAEIVSDDSGSAAGIQQVISAEGLALAGGISTSITAANDALRIGFVPGIDAYSQDDLLLFTIAGADIASSTTQSGVTLQYDNGGTWVTVARALGVDTSTGVITFGLVDTDNDDTNGLTNLLASDADSATYYIDGVDLEDVDATTGISVSYNGLRQQVPIDPASATSVAQVGSQFSLGANTDYDLDATIDVEAERMTFVDAEAGDDFFNSMGDSSTAESSETNNDTFTLSVASSADLLVADASSVVHSLTTSTNFDWTLDSDGDYAGASATGSSSVTGVTVADDLSDDESTLVVTASGTGVGSSTTTVTLTVPGTATLEEADFEVATTVNYYLGVTTTADSVDLGTTDVGSWGLSGATRFVEFYPTGVGITQFVYIANTSDVDAEVEMTVMDASGTAYECGILDTVALGNAVTNFGAEVFSTLEECGVVGNRLAISFTINAPDAAIDLTAGYNSRGDRVLVD